MRRTVRCRTPRALDPGWAERAARSHRRTGWAGQLPWPTSACLTARNGTGWKQHARAVVFQELEQELRRLGPLLPPVRRSLGRPAGEQDGGGDLLRARGSCQRAGGRSRTCWPEGWLELATLCHAVAGTGEGRPGSAGSRRGRPQLSLPHPRAPPGAVRGAGEAACWSSGRAHGYGGLLFFFQPKLWLCYWTQRGELLRGLLFYSRELALSCG
jgi:hypothetical protein